MGGIEHSQDRCYRVSEMVSRQEIEASPRIVEWRRQKLTVMISPFPGVEFRHTDIREDGTVFLTIERVPYAEALRRWTKRLAGDSPEG